MPTKRIRTACVLVALIAGADGADANAAAASAADASPTSSAGPQAQSARAVIGQELHNGANEPLGKVQDLVVNADSGRVDYAIVASGGVLGFGEKLRAVPFAALRPAQAGAGAVRLELGIDRAKWDAAPLLADGDISLLATPAGEPVRDYFGQADSRGDQTGQPGTDRNAGNDTLHGRSQPLMSLGQVLGKEVVNAGQKVGDVEDVLIHFETRHASALIKPDQDYIGSDRNFLIGFSRLMTAIDDDVRLTTSLTRDNFAKAQPVRTEWWMADPESPHVWSTYVNSGIASPAVVDTERGAAE